MRQRGHCRKEGCWIASAAWTTRAWARGDGSGVACVPQAEQRGLVSRWRRRLCEGARDGQNCLFAAWSQQSRCIWLQKR